jgi:hypothetical protein
MIQSGVYAPTELRHTRFAVVVYRDLAANSESSCFVVYFFAVADWSTNPLHVAEHEIGCILIVVLLCMKLTARSAELLRSCKH